MDRRRRLWRRRLQQGFPASRLAESQLLSLRTDSSRQRSNSEQHQRRSLLSYLGRVTLQSWHDPRRQLVSRSGSSGSGSRQLLSGDGQISVSADDEQPPGDTQSADGASLAEADPSAQDDKSSRSEAFSAGSFTVPESHTAEAHAAAARKQDGGGDPSAAKGQEALVVQQSVQDEQNDCRPGRLLFRLQTMELNLQPLR